MSRWTATSAGLVLATTLLLLTGCGGGGGGTSIASSNESPDPVVVEIPIAYIKRPAPEPEGDVVRYTNLNDPIEMFPGARLYVRPRSSSLANEIDLTDRIADIIATELDADPELLAIDIKGLAASFDGSQLVFSVRAIPDIENNNEPELYTWNLWRYDFEEDALSYVINSALVRDEGADTGSAHDMEPHFLTDDRIVFSSSRQAAIQEKQLNEGRGQRYSPLADDNNTQAIGLHVIDPDTQEISQITLGSTADINAAPLESGELIFSRRGTDGIYSLYQVNPSGARESVLYGANSSVLLISEESAFGVSGDINFLHPRELPDGKVLVMLTPDARSTLGGDVALVDTDNFVELFTPVSGYTGSEMRAQTPLDDLEVNALDDFSPAGKYLSAYPLRDGSERILVSWSPCRIVNEEELIKPCSIATDDDRVDDGTGNLNFEPAPALFGLWLHDPNQQTQLPVVLAEEGFVISEAIAAEPRAFPDAPDESDVFDPALAAENQGLIIIDSVYNEDDGLVSYAPLGIEAYRVPGTTAYLNRPGRFMRVLQPVPEPNDDVLDDRPPQGGVYGMLEILGYVPVEPDGSVSVKVPADTPLILNTLRDDGRRISPRHASGGRTHWISVAPGEILRCVGCHDSGSGLPHGRLDSLPPSQNPGAISLSSGLIGFPGTTSELFASELGQTMAEVYDLRKPDLDTSQRVRELQLQLTYDDEWADISGGVTPDASINLTYDPAWNLPAAFPIISPNLDPSLQGRIVINYNDHIQPIWERERTITQDGEEVLAPDGITPATSCVSCHTTNSNTLVPAGQLDLTALETENFTISYEELTQGDDEYWYIDDDAIAVRERICDEVDPNGNPIQVIETFPVPAVVNRGSAIASAAFFNCFENNNPDLCGRYVPDRAPPPANCSDDGGTINDDSAPTTKPIPDTFAEAEALMDQKDMVTDGTPSLLETDELMELLNTNCSSCHSTAGGEVPHSDPVATTAYNAMKPYISLVNPGASTFVFRLRTQNHNCWDMDGDMAADCDDNATAMETAISSFAAAVPEEEVTVSGGSTATDASFDHFGLLSDSELRLISEWLDTGGAFYNNPFDPRLYE